MTPQGEAGDPGGVWVRHEGALAGLRVLDLTRILSGPFATMVLADLGADVVKVEDTHGGDDTRRWGPPFLDDDAAYYHSVNRNKRSLAVDLKRPEGLELVRRLAATADVVLENFRPGTAARLGLGYDDLSALNPRLVYGSISGFGQTGPESHRAGYDAIAQAMSGVMGLTGPADGEPVRFGVAGADLGAGMWLVIGVLAALRSRDETGRGQRVDISLLDGMLSWLTYAAQNYFTTGQRPHRHGSAHPNIVPYQAFRTAEGDLMVAVGNDSLWARFAPVLGLGHLVDDPRFATNPDRVRNRRELLPMVEHAFLARPATEWAGLLEEAGVPAGPVHEVDEALAHPQVLARDMVVELPHPHGPLRTLGSPLKLSGTPPQLRHASPSYGQHTRELLLALGLSAVEVDGLVAEGVVRE